MKARYVAMALLWASSLVGVGLWAQESGSVSGTVADSQGGVIPGAAVVLIGESRGTRSAPVVTTATGYYVFPGVAPGLYTVEVSMPGFRSLRRTGIAVGAGDRIAIPTVTLEVAGAVPAAAPQTGPFRPGDGMGPVISGADIGFQPMSSPNTPAGAVAGRWMVRVNGEWLVATTPVRAVPVR